MAGGIAERHNLATFRPSNSLGRYFIFSEGLAALSHCGGIGGEFGGRNFGEEEIYADRLPRISDRFHRLRHGRKCRHSHCGEGILGISPDQYGKMVQSWGR